MAVVIRGLKPFPELVRGLDHSWTTCVTTAITPMHEIHSLIRSEASTKIETGVPKCARKLDRIVFPVIEVYLPNSIIRKKVKTQDINSGHIRVIPNAAPEEAMVVILPVPILYPIRNIPGAIEAMKRPVFFSKIGECWFLVVYLIFFYQFRIGINSQSRCIGDRNVSVFDGI